MDIGTPVTLELLHTDHTSHELYKSKVVDIKGSYLFLSLPSGEKSGKTVFIHEGTPFNLRFVGKDQSVYMFETSMIAKKKFKIPVLIFHLPDENKFKRIQRRKYVRIETAVDVAIKSRGKDSFTSITTDISGGGAAIVLPERHECAPGNLVEILFVFHMKAGDVHYIDAKAEVVRVFKGKGMERESASVEFHNITEGSRQTIIQYCFERQLYMKGKRVR